MTEKLLLIAKYDGWKVDPEYPQYTFMYKDGAVYELKDLAYFTDLNMLHPVAMKVKEQLSSKELDIKFTSREDRREAVIIKKEIILSCAMEPYKGEYIGLFDAVCKGIALIIRYQNN